jgi:hypothetical protein
VAHRSVSAGDCLSGAEDLDDSPSHLRHYINRWVGVKLPQHSLLLHCFAAKILTKVEACLLHPQPKLFTLLKLRKKKELRQSKEKFSTSFKINKKFNHQMARVRSTARITHDGEEAEGAETAPISEVMQRSGLVASEDAPAAEAERADVETKSEDDYSAVPSKPSHLDFGKSTISEDDLPKLLNLGYFNEAKKELVRFGGEETTPKPGKDEVVVFKSFFKAGLRFPLNKMIADVLKKFGIYLHQLTPNAIVRLSVYIWALRSQGVEPFAEGFCRVHELHYQTKARGDGLHENFGCYNFAYRKSTKFPVISYRSKWPAGWKSEWFYVKVDEDKEMLVQSPLELIFGETRPQCNMTPGSPSQIALAEFRVIADHIGTRDLVQEFLAFRVFPTLKEWDMPKLKGGIYSVALPL